MTVKELKIALLFYPDNYPVFVVDSWKDWPYTLTEPLHEVRSIVAADIDGGTFDWGIISDPETGLTTPGILLMPEPFDDQDLDIRIKPKK